MWPMFGRATASPVQNLLKYAPRVSAFPRAVHREQLNSKLWVCQQCYHHNSRALDSAWGVRTAQRDGRRRVRASRAVPPKLNSRTLSTDSGNATEKPRSDLPSQEEGRRSQISKRFSHVMDHLQSNIFIAGQRLNDLTGYSGIEALKKDIEQQGPSSTLSLSWRSRR